MRHAAREEIMKEKFIYKSGWLDFFVFLCLISGIVFAIVSWTVLLVFFAAFIFLSIFLSNMSGQFCADDNSVSFNLVFKKINIPYDSIKSAEVSREFIRGGRLTGEAYRCIETIKFTCESGEYCFSTFIGVDSEAVAKAPELLAEQFAQSKFSRLKNYIDEKTGGRITNSAPDKITEDTDMQNENGEMLFEKTKCDVPHKLHTQTLERAAKNWQDVLDRVLEMFDDDDEFVTLTVGDARHNIRYVQAVRDTRGDRIIVQLGIEDENHTRLVEKLCGENECVEIFREFYDSASVRELDKYKPVKF